MIRYCPERALLIQAELDGELDTAEIAELSAHVEGCAGCAALRAELMGLSRRVRRSLQAEPMPAALRSRVVAALPVPSSPARRGFAGRRAALGAGLAMAASLALVLLPSRSDPADGMLIDLHIRALQPGHLLDVVSTDQHTVKPWFDGRIDFAPPVKDFAAAGFPLTGGRLDYLDRRPVAVLVYRRDKHVIDLFVSRDDRPAASLEQDGYRVVSWREGGLLLRAVSDVEAGELQHFVQLWRTMP